MSSKALRYILYAFGEILLIVIGVLIAVSIDNWNESQKKEEALRKVLSAISFDLREDIPEYDFLLRHEYENDSLLRLVLQGKLTEQDYQHNWRDLHRLIVRAYGFSEHKNGYSALQTLLEDLPADFRPLIDDITDYYVVQSAGAYDVLLREDRLVWGTIQEWEKYPWNYVARIDSNVNREKLAYLLHAPEYKNKCATFLACVGNVIEACEGGRYDALDNYLDIATQLNKSPESTLLEMKELLEIESASKLTPCANFTSPPPSAKSRITSIVLLRNRSDQPLRIFPATDENLSDDESLEIPANSIVFYDFNNGEISKVVNTKNQCVGYFQATAHHALIEF